MRHNGSASDNKIIINFKPHFDYVWFFSRESESVSDYKKYRSSLRELFHPAPFQDFSVKFELRAG
jgi:hypothetical protein